MQQKGIARIFMVTRLYRRILKLHRHLPPELKELGDQYAKDEFQRHKDANQLQAHEFMNEWKAYADTIESQHSTGNLGRNLEQKEVDALSQEQFGQLYELQQQTAYPSQPIENDINE